MLLRQKDQQTYDKYSRLETIQALYNDYLSINLQDSLQLLLRSPLFLLSYLQCL